MMCETGLEVAVIGMAARFPGANNISEFWHNLKNGVESIVFFSEEELLDEGHRIEQLENPQYIKCGGGLLKNIEYFDAAFFGYSAVEAEMMDPQVRIFHECSWHALEHAGYDPFSYDGLVGLYGGASFNIFWEAAAFLTGRVDVLGAFAAGLLIDRDYLCTRVSYTLNLKGPSVVVKTACSTSLAAVHIACQAILNGECDIALAGGVTITRLSKAGYIYMDNMIASPDGHCRVFDSRAKGTIPGDGVGIVALKRLEDAVKDNDHIIAVIKGTALNNDGVRKAGYTAPSISGQYEVIRDALRLAEVDPETVSYLETHGTGTVVGDPIEIEALKKAFDTGKKGYCAIGSVKSNVGHLDSAAGVAGLIKTILSLQYKLIPPSLHFETPNSKIDFENSPFYVNTRLLEWKSDEHPLRAGVSSFGVGGTNAHIVLEEWPEWTGIVDPALKKGGLHRPPLSNANSAANRPQLLLLSAKTKNTLETMTKNLCDYFKEKRAAPGNPENTQTGVNQKHILADVAYTLQTGRRAFPQRRMVVCTDLDGAIEALSSPGIGKVRSSHTKEDKKSPIFMFAGIGSQYVDMGLELYRREPLFREEMDLCFNIIKPLAGYDIKGILYPSLVLSPSPSTEVKNNSRENPGGLREVEIASLVIFSLEYALARLLIKWGIKPHAVIGYSLGEYTAACISGVYALEDAINVIVTRGRLIAGIPTGTMLSVPMRANELKSLLGDEISIAIDNGPSCIIAGPESALLDFQKQLKGNRYLCMPLTNTHAIHSPMMEPILREFERFMGGITLNNPEIPYVSNVTGQWISIREAVDPAYWSRHLRETVRFADGITQLLKEPNPIFIEIGPGRDLSTLLVRYKEENPGAPPIQTVNLIRPAQQAVPDDSYFLSKVGQLWLYGLKVDWRSISREESPHRIPLPLYPFESRRYWFEGNPFRGGTVRQTNRPSPSSAAPAEAEEGDDSPPLYQRPELDTLYVSPSNETEQILARTWQQFFGIEAIGIDDDFFDLGGDSLKATLVVSMLYKELKIRIPVVEVFNQPTIRKLAQYISRKEIEKPGQLDDHLYILKESSNRATHLFIIHDGTGEIQSYFDLCNRLTTDMNTWAIKAEEIRHYTPMNLTIERLAEKYLEKISRISPEGPYYIAGWSFGGRVAYEIVRQLEQRNKEIKFLGIIDVAAPQEIQIPEFDYSIESELNWISTYFRGEEIREIREKMAHVTQLEQFWPLMIEILEEKGYRIEDLKPVLPGDMPRAIPGFNQLGIGEVIYHLNMIRTFARAERFYFPTGKISTPTFLFEAGEQTMEKVNLQWSDFCSNLVKTYKVPGNHFTMFRPPQVAELVRLLDSTLAEVMN